MSAANPTLNLYFNFKDPQGRGCGNCSGSGVGGLWFVVIVVAVGSGSLRCEIRRKKNVSGRNFGSYGK